VVRKNENDKVNEEVVEKDAEIKQKEECFVIMPIGDHPSHEKGHFLKIYRDLIKPAIEDAGFEAYRADEGGGSQNIQIDIIKKIIEAPMAVCDLSTRNPNVLFELGIRQAFDLPVALIQEVGTERIFDIQTFNTGEYRSARIYDEVMKDRESITNLIKATYRKHNEGEGINSIIRLLPNTIDKAKLSEKSIGSEELIKIMFNQINNLSKDISNVSRKLELSGLEEVSIEKGYKRERNSIIMQLLSSLSYEDRVIFSLVNDEKLTLGEIKERIEMPYIEINQRYSNVINHLIRYGIDLKKNNIVEEIIPF
jgi:hypothetical protein